MAPDLLSGATRLALPSPAAGLIAASQDTVPPGSPVADHDEVEPIDAGIRASVLAACAGAQTANCAPTNATRVGMCERRVMAPVLSNQT